MKLLSWFFNIFKPKKVFDFPAPKAVVKKPSIKKPTVQKATTRTKKK